MLSAKKKIYILILTFCLIDVLLFILVIFPLTRRVEENANEFRDQQKNLRTLEAQTVSLKDFQKNVNDLENYNLVVQNAFVDPTAPVSFLQFLEKWAINYNLVLTVSPFDSPAIKGDIWSSVGVKVDATGNLADCLRFVEMLENSPWVMMITRFDLQKNTTQEGVEATLSFDIKAFSGKSAVVKKN
ncbi:MAG: hypothetical protein NTZ42_04340 [Candidatus Gribaldobacteria bacterium]|nr:hypothetical protein [Candidatus Gribaldobacteria bacterium]